MARARRQSVPPEAYEWASGLPETFLTCRDLGHPWRPHGAAWDAVDHVYRREMLCARCRTVRVQLLSESGHVEGGHYLYADGYTKPAGTGQLGPDGRDLIRLLSVTHMIEKPDSGKASRPLRAVS